MDSPCATTNPTGARGDTIGPLLQRVFGIEALRCPRCGATLRLIAAIEDRAIARRILERVGLPARAPPLAPAAPSDTSSGRESELDDRWDFDQTVPGDDP